MGAIRRGRGRPSEARNGPRGRGKDVRRLEYRHPRAWTAGSAAWRRALVSMVVWQVKVAGKTAGRTVEGMARPLWQGSLAHVSSSAVTRMWALSAWLVAGHCFTGRERSTPWQKEGGGGCRSQIHTRTSQIRPDVSCRTRDAQQ